MAYYLVKDKKQPSNYFTSNSSAVYAAMLAKEEATATGKPIHLYKDEANGKYVYVDTKYPRKRNSGEITMSAEWQPCHAYRKLADGTVQVLTEAEGSRQVNSGRRKRVPNIAQGFWANGVFHPIRASADYDPRRAGEGGGKKKAAAKKRKPAKKAAKKKVAAKKRTPAKKSPAKRRAIAISRPRSMSRDYYE
jgi:hypothetical protein